MAHEMGDLEQKIRLGVGSAAAAAAIFAPLNYRAKSILTGIAASAILSAAGRHGADEPASTPIIVTGRSHHAAHRILGSVPVELLHESPYPVLTIS